MAKGYFYSYTDNMIGLSVIIREGLLYPARYFLPEASHLSTFTAVGERWECIAGATFLK